MGLRHRGGSYSSRIGSVSTTRCWSFKTERAAGLARNSGAGCSEKAVEEEQRLRRRRRTREAGDELRRCHVLETRWAVEIGDRAYIP
eukprot:3444517-Pleurochrysis_carterae.AAC.2